MTEHTTSAAASGASAAEPEMVAALQACLKWIPSVPKDKGAPHEETRGAVYKTVFDALVKAGVSPKTPVWQLNLVTGKMKRLD